MHTKVKDTRSFMIEETLEKYLMLDQIASDFSAPTSPETQAIASVLSSAFFLAGGAAGLVSVGASFLGASAAGAVGNVNAARSRARSRNNGEESDSDREKFDKLEENAQRQVDKAADVGRYAGATGAGTVSLSHSFLG